MTILKSIGEETKILLEREFQVCCSYLSSFVINSQQYYCKMTEVFNFQRFFAISEKMS